jgi:16S rRNA (cytosine1402-N4)-methyltransferase
VRFNGALDMRMNQNAEKDARWIVANYSEEQLAQIIYLYGELKSSRRIAAAIVKARQVKPILTTGDLLEVIKPCLNPRQEKKEAILVFQALRIEVNDEMSVLKSLLQQSIKVLKPGGRFAILTYHSLEDRLVKNFMRSGNLSGNVEKDFYGRNLSPLKLITSKPIVPSDEEVERNPRSRSAKLRIAEMM